MDVEFVSSVFKVEHEPSVFKDSFIALKVKTRKVKKREQRQGKRKEA